MATIGPLFVGTGANYNDGGTTAWTNPTNFQGDTTSTAATCSVGSNGGTSQKLRGSAFGFTQLGGATINGVTVEVEASSANNNRQYWNNVQLLVAGTETGDNKSDGAAINTSKAFKTFGGSTDGWNASLDGAKIMTSGFGISVKIVRSTSQSTTTSMFRARITVDYTPAGFGIAAVIKGTPTGSTSVAAVLGTSQSGAFPVEAVRHEEVQGDISLDAIQSKTLEPPGLPLDGVIHSEQSGSFPIDAVVFSAIEGSFPVEYQWSGGGQTFEGNFSVEAVLGQTAAGSFAVAAVQQKTISTTGAGTGVFDGGVFDAGVFDVGGGGIVLAAEISLGLITHESSFKADAVLRKTINPNFPVDAVTKRTIEPTGFPVQAEKASLTTYFGNFTVDAVQTRTIDSGWAVDAVLTRTIEPTGFSVQAEKTALVTHTGDFPVEAVLRGTVEPAGWVVAAVLSTTTASSFPVEYQWINVQTIPGSFPADAVLTGTTTSGLAVAAVITATLGSTFPVEYQWTILITYPGSFPVDAIRRKVIASSFPTRAVKQKTILKTFTIQALKEWVVEGSFPVEYRWERGFFIAAQIVQTYKKLFNVAANLAWRSFPVAATIQSPRSSGFGIAAEKIPYGATRISGSSYLDALLLGPRSSSFPIDAVIRVAGGSFALEADIKGQNEQRGLFGMSAVLGRRTTKTFALNGVVNPLGQWRFFIDAWIQPSFAIAAYIVLGSGSGNFGAAAALKRTMTPSGFPINADLKGAGEVRATFPLDAIRLATVGSGVWVDASLVAKPFPSFSIDAFLVGTMYRSFPVDAYIRADNIVIYPEDGGDPHLPSGAPLPPGYAAERAYRIRITVGGTEVTGDVIWGRTRFTQYAKTGPGTFEMVLEGAFTFKGGEEVLVDVDGLRTFGGYVLQIEYGYAFEANATPLTTLRGTDFNLLFDRTIIYNKPYLAEFWEEHHSRGGEYINWLSFAKGTLDTTIINKVFSDYVDLPEGFNYTDHVTSVGSVATEVPWTLPTAGSNLRKVMQSISQVTNAVWWIDANKCLWYTDRTTVTAPYPITDGLGGITAREVGMTSDMSQLVTEDWLWGTLARTTSGDIVVSHHEQPESLATYGHWQYGEERTEIHHASWLSKRAGSVISRYGQPLHRANVTIYDPGYQAGMVASVRLDAHGLNENLVIREMTLDFAMGKEPVGEVYYGLPRYRLTMGLDPETPWTIYDYLPYPDEEKGTTKKSDVPYRRFWLARPLCGITDTFSRTGNIGSIIWYDGYPVPDLGGWGTSEAGIPWVYDALFWGNELPLGNLSLSTDGDRGVLEFTHDDTNYDFLYPNSPGLKFIQQRTNDLTMTVHAQFTDYLGYGELPDYDLWYEGLQHMWVPYAQWFQITDGDWERGLETFSMSGLRIDGAFHNPPHDYFEPSIRLIVRDPGGDYVGNMPRVYVGKRPWSTGYWVKIHAAPDGGDAKFWWDDEEEPAGWMVSYHDLPANQMYHDFQWASYDNWNTEEAPNIVRLEFDNLDIDVLPACGDSYLTDTFTRTVSSGWGISDAGISWGWHGSAGSMQASVDGSRGKLTSASTASAAQQLGTGTYSIPLDLTVQCEMIKNSAPGGRPAAVIDVGWEYSVEVILNSDTGLVSLLGNYDLRVIDSETMDLSGVMNVKVRLEAVNGYAKIWKEGTTEPEAWTLSGDITDGGGTETKSIIYLGASVYANDIVYFDNLDIEGVPDHNTGCQTDNFSRTVADGWGTGVFGEWLEGGFGTPGPTNVDGDLARIGGMQYVNLPTTWVRWGVTYEARFRWNASGGSSSFQMGGYDEFSGYFGFDIHVQDGNLQPFVGFSPGNGDETWGGTFPTTEWASGRWYRVKWTWTNSHTDWKLWVDGEAEPVDWQVWDQMSIPSTADGPESFHVVTYVDCTVDWIKMCDNSEVVALANTTIDGWNTETLAVSDNLFTTTAKVTPYTMSVSDQDGRYLYPMTDWKYDDNTGYNFWVKDGVTSVIVRYLTLSPVLNVNRPTPRGRGSGRGGHRPI